jgi:hypothetical protein
MCTVFLTRIFKDSEANNTSTFVSSLDVLSSDLQGPTNVCSTLFHRLLQERTLKIQIAPSTNNIHINISIEN